MRVRLQVAAIFVVMYVICSVTCLNSRESNFTSSVNMICRKFTVGVVKYILDCELNTG